MSDEDAGRRRFRKAAAVTPVNCDSLDVRLLLLSPAAGSQHVIVQTLLGPTVFLYFLFCEDAVCSKWVRVPMGSVSGCSGQGSGKGLGMLKELG